MNIFFPISSLPQDLVASGAQVCICNRFGETPLDKAKPYLSQLLQGQRSLKVIEIGHLHCIILHIRTRSQVFVYKSHVKRRLSSSGHVDLSILSGEHFTKQD